MLNPINEVDASESGEGSLEILVKPKFGPSIPAHVISLGGAIFKVEFTPTEQNDHIVQVTFNEEHVPGTIYINA